MRGPTALLLLALVPLVLGATCAAETDRDLYARGDLGAATFRNGSGGPVYLEGCSAYRLERRADERWVDQGPAVVCAWQGFARPVAAGESLSFGLIAPGEPGAWRLRFPVGLGCDPLAPLSAGSCAVTGAVHTPAFDVVALCEPRECGPPLGMPNVLCADGSLGGPTGRCLLDPESGRCGWEIASCPEAP